jgi:hypothetical protein
MLNTRYVKDLYTYKRLFLLLSIWTGQFVLDILESCSSILVLSNFLVAIKCEVWRPDFQTACPFAIDFTAAMESQQAIRLKFNLLFVGLVRWNC